MREVNGKQYIVHQVSLHDTLIKLSIKYNVSVQTIRGVNGLLTEEIFQKNELLVPVQPGMSFTPEQP